MLARNFTDILALANSIAREQDTSTRSVVRELIQYEILNALLEMDVLQTLTFQGGTALHLSYNEMRFSEDLDFVGGINFDPHIMDEFELALSQKIGQRYSLAVTVKPRIGATGIATWKAIIRIPDSNRANKQSEMIQIEVANIPAYTRNTQKRIHTLTRDLETVYTSLFVPVESLEEIAADKVIAFGVRRYVTYRDIWDLWGLSDRNLDRVQVSNLIQKKLSDYRIDLNQFTVSTSARLKEMSTHYYQKKFTAEMERFVYGTVRRMLDDRDTVVSIIEQAKALVSTYLAPTP